ncbi:AraC family transcriptional regulator [Bordetella genomosp. 9]|uniref:AraC family transcriptional regulator n=1 Tax=Bordetella genomosp. 9 TaxID=1416803 RepID=A0A1W6YXB3_9BORD|nr:AraC family transcriptional regulator [Bordetella genomosp. 9]ARP85752.1 AraC family transcriptional regulator [Bordetella genomosp. 9]ARP89729.1 AraC family transcriptional regulator [Bordetella genomosp. 9]
MGLNDDTDSLFERRGAPGDAPCSQPPTSFPAAVAPVSGPRQELVERLSRLTGSLEGSMHTAVPGLHLHRITCSDGPHHAVQLPVFAVIAQGSKQLLVGNEVYRYDPLHYMVSSVELPVAGKVAVGSASEPYLGLRLDLDVDEIHALISDIDVPGPLQAEPTRGLYVNPLNDTLLDGVLRLLRLLETPRDIPVLAPMVKREILYRLLVNGQGGVLRQLVMKDSHTQRIARAIQLLREHYSRPLRIEELARQAHMSPSSFHHHFKAVTAMSPLQFQKQLRLQEARRLMFMSDADVAVVAHQVGYESPSQFSREYSRLFGTAPLRDKRRWLRTSAAH